MTGEAPVGAEAGPVLRVLVCDDHPVVREGIRGMLERSPDVEVVGEASDGLEAVELAGKLAPDVVLMDLAMPGADGVTATVQIRERRPETRVLILTSFENDEDVERAVRGGATGYLLKDAPPDELLRAVRLAARGDAALAPAITGRLMRQLTEPARSELNERELKILDLVARGKSNRDIADELWIGVETVKSQLEAARQKLGATDRTNAVFIAASRGLIRPPASRTPPAPPGGAGGTPRH